MINFHKRLEVSIFTIFAIHVIKRTEKVCLISRRKTFKIFSGTFTSLFSPFRVHLFSRIVYIFQAFAITSLFLHMSWVYYFLQLEHKSHQIPSLAFTSWTWWVISLHIKISLSNILHSKCWLLPERYSFYLKYKILYHNREALEKFQMTNFCLNDSSTFQDSLCILNSKPQ